MIHVRIVLFHRLGDLIVHEILDPSGLGFALRIDKANDLGLDRAAGGQKFLVRLRLELRHGLGDQRVRNARRALERLGALDGLNAQQVQALCVGFFPLLTRLEIVFVGCLKGVRDLTKLGFLEILGQVCVVRDLYLGFQHSQSFREGLDSRAAILVLSDNSATSKVFRRWDGYVDARKALVGTALHHSGIDHRSSCVRRHSHQ